MQLDIGYIIILDFCLIGVFFLFTGVVRMMNLIVFTSYFQEFFAHVCRILIRPTVKYICWSHKMCQ